jgi:hypothetical protein
MEGEGKMVALSLTLRTEPLRRDFHYGLIYSLLWGVVESESIEGPEGWNNSLIGFLFYCNAMSILTWYENLFLDLKTW